MPCMAWLFSRRSLALRLPARSSCVCHRESLYDELFFGSCLEMLHWSSVSKLTQSKEHAGLPT